MESIEQRVGLWVWLVAWKYASCVDIFLRYEVDMIPPP